MYILKWYFGNRESSKYNSLLLSLDYFSLYYIIQIIIIWWQFDRTDVHIDCYRLVIYIFFFLYPFYRQKVMFVLGINHEENNVCRKCIILWRRPAGFLIQVYTRCTHYTRKGDRKSSYGAFYELTRRRALWGEAASALEFFQDPYLGRGDESTFTKICSSTCLRGIRFCRRGSGEARGSLFVIINH